MLYKDYWSQMSIRDYLMYDLNDIALKYTYDDFLDASKNMKYTTWELMFIAQIGSSNNSVTLPVSQTNWYLYDRANVADYVIPKFASHYFTEAAIYKAITNNLKRRDKINDLLFVAKKWNTDYGTGDQTAS
jgi:hypothetical protein